MKRTVSVIVGLVASLAVASPADAEPGDGPMRTPDRLDYTITLSSNADATAWRGDQSIAFHNSGEETLDLVWVRLWGNSRYGCGTEEFGQAVTLSNVQGGTLEDLDVECTAAPIRLDEPVEPGERGRIGFDVSIDVPDGLDRLGRDGEYVHVSSAIPLMSVLDERGWHLPPAANLESYLSLNSDFSVALRHPAHFTIPATGEQIGSVSDGDMTWSRFAARDVRDFSFGAGPFQRLTATTADGVTVNTWYPGDTAPAEAEDISRWGVEAMDEFTKLYGPYAYAELDLVWRGGVEYPGMVWIAHDRETVVHEVGHQWFHTMVGNDQYYDPWLDEGFTQYAQRRFVSGGEHPECEGTPNWLAKEQRVDMGLDQYDPEHPEYLGGAVYYHAECMLHELEGMIGAEAMNRALRQYVTRFRYDVATSDDARGVLEKAAGGDLSAFWERWRNTGP